MRIRHLGELYDFLQPGELLENDRLTEDIKETWEISRPDAWVLDTEQG